jgi:hypothetical protein
MTKKSKRNTATNVTNVISGETILAFGVAS